MATAASQGVEEEAPNGGITEEAGQPTELSTLGGFFSFPLFFFFVSVHELSMFFFFFVKY